MVLQINDQQKPQQIWRTNISFYIKYVLRTFIATYAVEHV